MNTSITLINDDGTLKPIFAEKKSVRQSEHYEAMQAGLDPTIMFKVHAFEYHDQVRLRFNGEDFKITRAFEAKGEKIELICEKV